MATFDLSAVSEQYYRDNLRLGHWILIGAFLLFAVLIAERVIVAGPQQSFVPLYVLAGALEGVFGYFGFVASTRGPVELQASEGSVSFRYRGGRTRTFGVGTSGRRLRLLEQVSPPTAKRLTVNDKPGLFAVMGVERIALSRPALDAIVSELNRPGISVRSHTKPNPRYGEWTIRDYTRTRA